jgi:hypothetical protein
MSALEIPGIGERIGERYQRIIDFGFTGEASVDVVVTAAGAYPVVNINEPNVFIHKIDKQVVADFNSTAVCGDIGDTDVDGYWTDCLFLPAATQAVFANVTTTVAYAAGRLYTTTDVINVTLTNAVTEGNARLLIEYSRGVDTDITPATSS